MNAKRMEMDEGEKGWFTLDFIEVRSRDSVSRIRAAKWDSHYEILIMRLKWASYMKLSFYNKSKLS